METSGVSSPTATGLIDAPGSATTPNHRPSRPYSNETPGGLRKATPGVISQGQAPLLNDFLSSSSGGDLGAGKRGFSNANLGRPGRDASHRPHSAGLPPGTEPPGAGATLRSMSGEVLSHWGSSMLTKLQGIKQRHFSSEGSSEFLFDKRYCLGGMCSLEVETQGGWVGLGRSGEYGNV